MANLQLENTLARPLTTGVKPDDDLLKLGLGTVVQFWHGDDPVLGTLVGGVPRGYLSAPLYKQWIRGVDATGYFSYGPYSRINGVGSFKVWFFIEVTNRGGADDNVITTDVFDYDAQNRLAGPTTFKVRDFPAGSEGFTIYSPEMTIPSGNHRIESRVVAEGGASLKLWSIRWEIDTI